MKSLLDYINEASNMSVASKTIKFDFKDLENSEEVIKTLEESDDVTIDDTNVSITVKKENVANIESIQTTLKKYCDTIRNSQKRSSDESYAQKTLKFEKSLNELSDFIEELKNPQEDIEDSKDNDKTDDSKKEENCENGECNN